MLKLNHAFRQRTSARPLRGTDQQVLIVDDLLRNPDEVRDAALRMSYQREVPAYPGVTATPNWDCESFTSSLSRLAGRSLAAEEVALRLSMVTKRGDELESGQCIPHCDPVGLAGVVYLNLPEQCRGGTAFYRHRKSGLAEMPTQPDAKTLLTMIRHGIRTQEELFRWLITPTGSPNGYIAESTADWELIDLVEMRYNRLILYNGRLFHSGYIRDGDFGETESERRLTLNYFIDNETNFESKLMHG